MNYPNTKGNVHPSRVTTQYGKLLNISGVKYALIDAWNLGLIDIDVNKRTGQIKWRPKGETDWQP